MSERSNVSISEILGDNYYIDKLTSSDYSPAVGDTVTITLLVKDVFGDPVTGQTRTVTCTGGSFVSVNGSSITATSSVSVNTGSGGTVTLGLSVSVADNIIVSSGRVECVVSSLSTSITNHLEDLTWINFYNSGDGVQLWTNKALKLSYLQVNKSVSVSASSTITLKADYSTTDEKIPYCPPAATSCPTSRKDVYLTVNYIGGIKLLNYGSAFTNNVQGVMVFKAKG